MRYWALSAQGPSQQVKDLFTDSLNREGHGRSLRHETRVVGEWSLELGSSTPFQVHFPPTGHNYLPEGYSPSNRLSGKRPLLGILKKYADDGKEGPEVCGRLI